MDLYAATVVLNNGSNYRACITENYYNQLMNMNLAYRVRIEKEIVEIPIGNFRKVDL